MTIDHRHLRSRNARRDAQAYWMQHRKPGGCSSKRERCMYGRGHKCGYCGTRRFRKAAARSWAARRAWDFYPLEPTRPFPPKGRPLPTYGSQP